MTIFEKTSRDSPDELLSIVRTTLDALQHTVEQIEAGGQSAATERATLHRLQARLSRLEPGANAASGYRLH